LVLLFFRFSSSACLTPAELFFSLSAASGGFSFGLIPLFSLAQNKNPATRKFCHDMTF